MGVMMKVLSFYLLTILSITVSAGYSSVNPTTIANDVLIVLDDSGSMMPQADRIAQKLPVMVSNLETGRMNLGIIMSDLGVRGQDGGIFVGSSIVGSFERVLEGLNRDIRRLMTGSGTASEMFYEPILETFPQVSTQKSFHRKDAILNIYVVTDEDQDSSKDMNTWDFFNKLTQYKEIKKVVFNLVYPVGGCRQSQTPSVTDTELYKAVIMTGGQVLDLCDPNLKASATAW